MSLITKLVSSAFAVSAFAFAALAQDQPAKPSGEAKGILKEKRHDGFRRAMRGERMGLRGPGFGLRGVNLTDAQKDQIRQIHEANRPSQALLDEMKSFREALRDGTLTEDQKARMKAIHDEQRQKAASVHDQVLAVLTPEQKAQIEQRRQQMRQRMEERRQRMEQRRQQRQIDRSKDVVKDKTKVT